MLELRPIAYSLQFRGYMRQLSDRVLELRATAPSQALVTVVDGNGVAGRFEPGEGEEAILVTRLVVGMYETFHQSGTIRFGRSSNVRFRTMGPGRLSPSPDPHLRHGTAVWEVEDGEGQFERARGRITSNFFISDTGELTDNHLGLIFVARPETKGESRC